MSMASISPSRREVSPAESLRQRAKVLMPRFCLETAALHLESLLLLFFLGKLASATCELRWDFTEEERMMQYNRDKYFPLVKNQVFQSSRRTKKHLVSSNWTQTTNLCNAARTRVVNLTAVTSKIKLYGI